MTITASVTLTVAEDEAQITVTVESQFGPVASTPVEVAGPTNESGTTDESGQVVFSPLRPGTYDVTATAFGATDTVDVTGGN